MPYTGVEVRWPRKVSVMRWHCGRDLGEPFSIGGGGDLWADSTASAKALTEASDYVRATADVSGGERWRG